MIAFYIFISPIYEIISLNDMILYLFKSISVIILSIFYISYYKSFFIDDKLVNESSKVINESVM